MAYSRFLGYEKGEDGQPKIVEAEAEVVRQIYTLFLEGKTYRTIAEMLTTQNIPTPSKKAKWSVSTVMSILKNEKYKGCALLQKTFTVDFLNKTSKINEGEVPQFFVENSHPAIIDPETWELVQSETKKRTSVRRQVNNNSPFAAKVICGQCGGFYGAKVWHSTDQYRTHIWQCNRKYQSGTFCITPHLREETLKQVFVLAMGQILGDKEQFIRKFEQLLPSLADTIKPKTRREKLMVEQSEKEHQLRLHIEHNARTVQDQEDYERIYSKLAAELTSLGQQVSAIDDEILERVARKEKIRRFLDELRETGDIVTEFDENLWNATVESLTVHSTKDVTVTFRDGTEISIVVPEEK